MEQVSLSKYPIKTSVLIIDDHMLFNEGLSLILKESASFEVIGQVYDSREAQFEYHKLMPQLVLVDYNMPHLNGLEVVKQLKAQNSTSKIVVISMYADYREIAKFKEVGVDGYITKTTPSTDLINSLEKIMKGESVFTQLNEGKVAYEKDSFALKNKLTKREIEVLKVLKKGLTTEQIAQELSLSFYTVETHRKNINHKLNLKTKKEFYDFLETIEG